MTTTQTGTACADFAAFVADRRRALLRFAMVLTGDARRAEDIVADVLARAYERWDRIGVMDQAGAYVRRMIVNDYLSWRSRLRRTTPYSDLAPYSPSMPDPAQRHAERAALIARLRNLPRRQRAAVALRYFEDLADPQIADLLGCSVGTVRSHISRALATLRVAMTEEEI